MQKPQHSHLTRVTADQWADTVTNYRTRATEENFRGGYSVMLHWQTEPPEHDGRCVGAVHYLPDNSREYFALVL
jgi:hypothetical protein